MDSFFFNFTGDFIKDSIPYEWSNIGDVWSEIPYVILVYVRKIWFYVNVISDENSMFLKYFFYHIHEFFICVL